MNAENVKYFGSFGVEHIPKEIRKFIKNKIFVTNVYRIQANDSMMCGYICIGFINFMLLEYTTLFSRNEYKK